MCDCGRVYVANIKDRYGKLYITTITGSSEEACLSLLMDDIEASVQSL
jgi:hypothetical protein